jgi:hypothetical protein
MMKERRTRKLALSLGWDRVANVYTLTCDGGRPIRPMYRERCYGRGCTRGQELERFPELD